MSGADGTKHSVTAIIVIAADKFITGGSQRVLGVLQAGGGEDQAVAEGGRGRRWRRSDPSGQSAQRLGDRHDLVLDPVDPPLWSQSATTAWSICDNFYTMI